MPSSSWLFAVAAEVLLEVLAALSSQDVPAGLSTAWKYVLKGRAGEVVWQPGSDHKLDTISGQATMEVSEPWQSEELGVVSAEVSRDSSSEDPMSEVVESTVEETLAAPSSPEPAIDKAGVTTRRDEEAEEEASTAGGQEEAGESAGKRDQGSAEQAFEDAAEGVTQAASANTFGSAEEPEAPEVPIPGAIALSALAEMVDETPGEAGADSPPLGKGQGAAREQAKGASWGEKAWAVLVRGWGRTPLMDEEEARRNSAD
eukprot:SM000153S01616  [mRNA]  locus=s153:306337:307472:- [translate_table: standard]